MSKARDLANAADVLDDVSATELGYVNGVTSAIQTQIDSKEPTLPSQTGNSGKYLTTDGSTKSWGTVSQYALPSQTGNSGKFLTTNGTSESWGTVSTGGMTLISTTTLSGASVTLSSIPQTYNKLQIAVKSFKPAVDADYFYMRFNGETNYSYNQEITSTSSGQMTWDWQEIRFGLNGTNDNSVDRGLFIYEIPEYTSTTTYKTGLMYGLTIDPVSTSRFRGVFTNFYFFSTSAISSITFLASSGNMTSGTVLLYGVK